MALDEVNYLWEHWKFNAEQRIKAFNFFVVFSIFSNGGVFTSIEKCAGAPVLLLLGLFIVALAVIFWAIDIRSQRLIHLPVPGLKLFELTLRPEARLFHLDEPNRQRIVRFTHAFRALFIIQILFGLAVASYGVLSMFPASGGPPLPALAVCK